MPGRARPGEASVRRPRNRLSSNERSVATCRTRQLLTTSAFARLVSDAVLESIPKFSVEHRTSTPSCAGRAARRRSRCWRRRGWSRRRGRGGPRCPRTAADRRDAIIGAGRLGGHAGREGLDVFGGQRLAADAHVAAATSSTRAPSELRCRHWPCRPEPRPKARNLPTR